MSPAKIIVVQFSDDWGQDPMSRISRIRDFAEALHWKLADAGQGEVPDMDVATAQVTVNVFDAHALGDVRRDVVKQLRQHRLLEYADVA